MPPVTPEIEKPRPRMGQEIAPPIVVGPFDASEPLPPPIIAEPLTAPTGEISEADYNALADPGKFMSGFQSNEAPTSFRVPWSRNFLYRNLFQAHYFRPDEVNGWRDGIDPTSRWQVVFAKGAAQTGGILHTAMFGDANDPLSGLFCDHAGRITAGSVYAPNPGQPATPYILAIRPIGAAKAELAIQDQHLASKLNILDPSLVNQGDKSVVRDAHGNMLRHGMQQSIQVSPPQDSQVPPEGTISNDSWAAIRARQATKPA